MKRVAFVPMKARRLMSAVTEATYFFGITTALASKEISFSKVNRGGDSTQHHCPKRRKKKNISNLHQIQCNGLNQ